METRTEWFKARLVWAGINKFEEAGWAVRFLVPHRETSTGDFIETYDGYLVVFERIRSE